MIEGKKFCFAGVPVNAVRNDTAMLIAVTMRGNILFNLYYEEYEDMESDYKIIQNEIKKIGIQERFSLVFNQ